MDIISLNDHLILIVKLANFHLNQGKKNHKALINIGNQYLQSSINNMSTTHENKKQNFQNL